jgi:hypothetical protein
MEIWVNGVSQTVGVYLGLDGTPASLGNATSAIQVGHETAESIDGIDADYSEFAIHTSYMPDQYCVAYGLGYSPRFFGQTGFLYCPMWSATQLLNLWGSAVGTNSNGANAAHPPVIKPIGLHSAIFVPAVGQISLISSQVALVTSRRVIAY